MTAYFHNGQLLFNGGKIATSEDCCCGQTAPDCDNLPGRFRVTLSGLPTYGNVFDYTNTATMGPTTDPFSRLVCPPIPGFLGGEDQRYSKFSYDATNGSWNTDAALQVYGWEWRRLVDFDYYEHVLLDPPGSGVVIDKNVNAELELVVIIEDCIVGPGSVVVTAFLQHIYPVYYPAADWTKTVVLAPGETIFDHLPLTMDPDPNPWLGIGGHMAADYGVPDCSDYTPYADFTMPVAYPGMVLSLP